jgi:hypothetical protein
MEIKISGFAGFDGLQRTCVRFAKGKGGVYRCADYEKASKVGKHPKACSPGLVSRSPGLIRMEKCRRVAKKHSRRKRRR